MPGAMQQSLLSLVGQAKDPLWASVRSLLSFEGADNSTAVVDTVAPSRVITAVSGAHIDAEFAKFGATSLRISGESTGGAQYPTDTELNNGTADFTLEMWIRPLSWTNIASACGSASFTIRSQSGAFQVYDGASNRACGVLPTLGEWAHIAWTRAGGTNRVFVNGELRATFTQTTSKTLSALYVGRGQVSGQTFNGSIDELRWTVGVARYTGAFEIPTKAFPTK